MKHLEYLKNTSMGAFVGFLIGLAFMSMLGAEWGDDAKKYGTYGLTILASFLASGIAVFGVLASIGNQRSIENERRKADLRAARVVLPLALTRLSEVVDRGIERFSGPEEFFREEQAESVLIAELALGDDVINTLRDCIRNSDAVSGKWLANIIAHYQIYRSRSLGWVREPNYLRTDHSRASTVCDWIILGAMVSHTYNYARGAQAIPNNLEERLISIPLSKAFEPNFARLLADQIKTRKDYFSPFCAGKFNLLRDRA